MRLATFVSPAGPRAALVASDETLIPVVDLVPGGPTDMLGVISAGPALLETLRSAARSASGGTAVGEARLLAPIPRPRRNVICVGWNYLEHFEEGKGMRGNNPEPSDLPEFPVFFSKQPNCVVGSGEPVWHPAPVSDQLDWEAELAMVVGTAGRDLPEDRALSHVFGFTCANDVSVRDLQRRHGGQWWKGKNFDTHLPMGPWIVTADEIGDPGQDPGLAIRLRVNGEIKQDSSTRFLFFKLPRILKEVSAGMALEPGDVIITGTPSGVGFARNPPEYLKVGDEMEVEIEKIGSLRNRVQKFQG